MATILVVDEGGDRRGAACLRLRDAGHRCVCAGTGAEALSWCERAVGEIDLVVVNDILPDLSGAQVAHALARSPGAPRVILLRTHLWECLVLAGEPGALAAVLEPSHSLQQLVEAVDAALAG